MINFLVQETYQDVFENFRNFCDIRIVLSTNQGEIITFF